MGERKRKKYEKIAEEVTAYNEMLDNIEGQPEPPKEEAAGPSLKQMPSETLSVNRSDFESLDKFIYSISTAKQAGILNSDVALEKLIMHLVQMFSKN